MKTGLLIALSCLLIGALISFAFFRNNTIKYVDASINITEIRKIKQLHLVKHVYEDVILMHKGDDTTKTIQAIITVPVEISGYVDLEKCSLDSLSKELVVPAPQLTEPQYSTPNARHVRRVFSGKPADYINRYAKMLTARKTLIVERAKANKILENTREECENYFEQFFKSMSVTYKVRFRE